MHAVAWRTLRSASRSRSPARIIKNRRFPHPRSRPFHSSSSLSQTSNPPSNPESNPADRNEGTKNDGDKEVPTEKPEELARTEEPEVIAKKLQRSKDMVRHYGSALKRSQRHNRSQAQELPPIHIPEWFLRSNVWIREQTRNPMDKCANSVVTVKHGGTGDTYLSLPIRVSERTLKEYYQHLASLLERPLTGEELKQVKELIDQNQATRESEVGERVERFRQVAEANDKLELGVNFLVQAEIRATIAACLSSIRPEAAPSHPSTKTNIILESPSSEAGWYLNALVLRTLLDDMGVELVTLDALDLAELAGDYLGDGQEPSSSSVRSLGYETYRMKSELLKDAQEMEAKDEASDEQDPSDNPAASFDMPNASSLFGGGFPRPATPRNFRVVKIDPGLSSTLMKALGLPSENESQSALSTASGRLQTQNELQWEEMKLTSLLEAVVDANEEKRTRMTAREKKEAQNTGVTTPATSNSQEAKSLKFFDYSSKPSKTLEFNYNGSSLQFSLEIGQQPRPFRLPQKKKVIYLKDIKDINSTRRGSQILLKLQDIVQKRRAEGENIMIIGTSYGTNSLPEFSKAGVDSVQSEDNASYRTIIVPVEQKRDSSLEDPEIPPLSWPAPKAQKDLLRGFEMDKNKTINFRHIRDMLRRLDPAVSDRLSSPTHVSFYNPSLETFLSRPMSYDEVHRLALTALGLHLSQPNSEHLTGAHLSLAMSLLHYSDEMKYQWVAGEAENQTQQHIKKGTATSPRSSEPQSSSQIRGQQKLNRISKQADKYEKRLLSGVVNPDNIKTTFNDVHAPKETTEALRTLTTLSLLRPEAFKYGVLAADKIPGLLLYGPPGTGKTLLAKAVAKESGATVLEVSGSEVYDMYVGEGEKNVRAIFSLARKLSPCVVFIDEADAIFGSRSGGRQRTSHREIINQFLKEWDGMNDLSVFIMVATNRPFDLDDAVLRRLPRRLLVDLPTEADRKKILEIHLKGEQLDSSVSIDELAKNTPLYSGSDLKNLAVAAALACVREENEQAMIEVAKAMSEAAQAAESKAESDDSNSAELPPPPPMQQFLPEKRTLHDRHFKKAMQEISASISEDMSSLGAIKKFDEQFGDRKGRRKKSAYGFGVQVGKDESAARVRQPGQ